MKYKDFQQISKTAQFAWNKLSGVFVVYKSPEEHILQVFTTLKGHLCRDLNKMKVRPPCQHVWIEGETNKRMTVAVGPSYADHPLLTGPRYQKQDVRLLNANKLYTDMSGVLLIGVNAGIKTALAIQEGNPTKFYKVKGYLGTATDNFFYTGKVMEKTTWQHVRREHIDKICASMQSSYQKKMFELCGMPIQSQAAYQLAVQGPIRPTDNKIPMVYSIKCVDFKPPEFTLEIVCINDDEMLLKALVHEIGMQVRSTAACTQVQCVRFGLFTLEHALLKKHWTLNNILYSMEQCKMIVAENKFLRRQKDPILKEYSNVKRLEVRERKLLTAESMQN